jgi:SAM-dependent methyltransferase
MKNVDMMTWEEAVLSLRQQPGSEVLVKACFYDDPLKQAANRYWQSAEWHAVRRFLPKQRGKALDIGAGRGISSYALALDGWNVTALEPDPSDIVGAGAIRGLAREAGIRITVAEAWGEKLSFPDESFDLVYCRAALHHARDLRDLCCEMGRVLRKGGTLIATREHVISRQEDLPVFLKAHPLQHLYGGENAYLLSGYKRAIREAEITLTAVLSPSQSAINLYPVSSTDIKRSWARRLRFPFPELIPDFALTVYDMLSDTPGRLYSFIGQK